MAKPFGSVVIDGETTKLWVVLPLRDLEKLLNTEHTTRLAEYVAYRKDKMRRDPRRQYPPTEVTL
jgi:hypothetical protein